MYLMAGLLIVGAVCNFLVTPVDPRHHQPEFAAANRGKPTRPIDPKAQ
jgi:hypothetical protein